MAGAGKGLVPHRWDRCVFRMNYVCLGTCLRGNVFYASHDSEFSRNHLFPYFSSLYKRPMSCMSWLKKKKKEDTERGVQITL